MNTLKFLAYIKKQGIELRLEQGDQLRFKARKGALTPALKREIGARKQEIIAFLREAGARGAHARVISPVTRDPHPPASFAQERLWFIQQMAPEDPSFNMPLAFHLEGMVDVALVERCLSDLVQRHESLRTRFAVIDEKVVQIIASRAHLAMNMVDVSGLGKRDTDSLPRRLMVDAVRLPFSLEQDCLPRVYMFRQRLSRHRLLLNMHHIATDAQSLALAFAEMAQTYGARLQGRPPNLPRLSIQYADYAAWQRNWLRGEILEAELAHWEKALAGAPATIDLVTDFPRPAVASHQGAVYERQVPPDLAARLERLGTETNATPFMTLLAGYAVLLARYAAQEDLVIGTPSGNRGMAQTHALIGFFINLLVLRVDTRAAAHFHQLLRRVRQAALEAYAHQNLPFEKLVERLQPERNQARPPIFQVLFSLEDESGPSATGPNGGTKAGLAGLEIEPCAVDHHVTKYELSLYMVRGKDSLTARFDYASTLFEPGTIIRFANQYLTLLDHLTREPRVPLTAIAAMDPAERHLCLVSWNDTDTILPGASLAELFAAAAAAGPDAIALVQGLQQWSYAMLEARATAVARALNEVGVSRGSLVGLCLRPAPEMFAALIGILQAGGAYVPLDPEYPTERLAWMLNDSGMTALVSGRDYLERLPAFELNFLNLLILEDLDGRDQAAKTPKIPTGGQDLAYLMYTSGSTGRPKGSAIPQKAVIRLVHKPSYVRITSRDVFLQAASISFDAATLETWGALLNGARLGLLPEPSMDWVVKLAPRYRVSLLWLTAQVFHWLVESHIEALAGVRQLLAGGDVLSPDHVRRFLRAHPQNRLINGYGPTENTTFTCCYDASMGWRGASLPIGSPIGGTRVYVLDRHGRPVSLGVRGELCAGGDGLALGYWNRPRITAARFTPATFSNRPGARIYHIGDAVRWRSEGVIEFLGRLDSQIKLRGFRLEPGEIEHRLREHPMVQNAVVRVLASSDGEKKLVAYTTGDTRDGDNLRTFLAESLPDFMVPAVVIPLEGFPLTPNGKIDMEVLPLPENRRTRKALEQPRNPTEEMLAAIWARVLDVEMIGVHDDFFELGGHSLLATQIITRVRETFEVDLPLAALFATPTIAGLAAQIDRAARAKHDALPPPLRAYPRTGEVAESGHPLSFAQQRLWFLDQLEEARGAYNMPFALRLVGPLDTTSLEHGIADMARRHETLRTCFRPVKGGPRQFIREEVVIVPRVVDLRDIEPEGKNTLGRALAAAEGPLPFDLTSLPLCRINLLRLGETEHLLLVTLHHIISDGWSLSVLTHELGQCYRARLLKTRHDLPELTIQYADFTRWQRRWLAEASNLEAYWRKQLAGAPPLLELPTDRPRPPVQSFRGAWLPFQLDAELTRGLKTLSRDVGATLFMTLHTGLSLLLARYSGQDDVSVGVPIANRTHAEIEPLIGFFVNSLAIRLQVSGKKSFIDLLADVRRIALEAHAHQDMPFEAVVEALKPERNQSYAPLVQVMFLFLNTPAGRMALPGLEAKAFDLDQTTAKFDLTVGMEEHPERLEGSFEYSSDLFDRTTIARMIGHFTNLLRAAIDHPGQNSDSLPFFGRVEKTLVLQEWQDTATAGQGLNCHAFFENTATQCPDTLALQMPADAIGADPGPSAETQNSMLSYQALNQSANRLARHLRDLGVGPDSAVAICLRRSAAMTQSVLAVLKAGGMYVPLDPEYPKERLAFMFADAGISVLLTDREWVSHLPPFAGHTLFLDEENPSWNALPGHDRVGPSGNQPAYLIFTSGSTGRPKGATLTHRGLANLIAWQRDRLPAPARTIQFAALSFDVSFQEFFTTWSSRGCLILIRPALRLDFPVLNQMLRAWAVERFFLPFVVLQQLAEIADESRTYPSSLREIIASGEPLQRTPAIVRFFNRLPKCRLHNQYGPTETHVMLSFLCSGPPQSWAPRPPLGRPIDRNRVYLLDPAGFPVPLGVRGSLHIAGAGLGRGYRHRPRPTAGAFLPNAFDAVAGTRLYRSGDAARFLADGNIEFLGRIDFQVKLRGFRVELGEIEAVLATYPGIRDAVVMVHDGTGTGSADRRLTAYLTPVLEGVDSTRLQTHLSRKLPDYMIPTAFVFLERMPLTPSGKVARANLAHTGGKYLATEAHSFVLPRNPVEEALAAIWSDLLRVDRVGVYDNFFELGGHSLLATRVLTRIRAAFHVELPVRALFAAPSLAALARTVTRARRGDRGEEPPLQTVARDKPLPLSFGQQRLWFLDQLEGSLGAYNLPFALRIEGFLHAFALERSLGEIMERHEVLRTSFSLNEGQPVQRIHPHEAGRLTVADLRSLTTAERERETARLARTEGGRPFNLSTIPLLRAVLIRAAVWEHICLGTMHHIASDGWSVGVLVRELAALYEARCLETPPSLPEMVFQYADYAVWQREWLAGDRANQQFTYWQKQLAGSPPLLELPVDRSRPSFQSFRGASLHFAVASSTLRRLRDLGRKRGLSLFMMLHAAFTAFLARYSGQDDVVVGTPVANRGRSEWEGLIGFFVNTLVLRVMLRDKARFLDLMERVRHTVLDALDHQDVPFEGVVEHLNLNRNLGHSPIFQVLFAFQNTPVEPLAIPGCRIAPISMDAGRAKFDLTLAMEESGDELYGLWEYNTDLFDRTTARRMVRHFQQLLDRVAATPECRPATMAFLNPVERQCLLCEWNDRAAPLKVTAPAFSTVEALARRIPDHVAMVGSTLDGDQKTIHLTHRALDRAAAGFAVHLADRGVGRHSLVALCAPRCLEIIAALLAIHKLGAAYVPLEADFPRERLQTHLNDARPTVVLTTKPYVKRLRDGGRQLLCLDEISPINRVNATTPRKLTVVGPELSHVIYTSGSTGEPKGVAITHGGVNALLNWVKTVYGPDDFRGTLAATSLCFDLSVFEIMGSLTQGGKLLLARNALALPSMPDREAVTLINTVPSAMTELLNLNAVPVSVRVVNLAGEPLRRVLVQRIDRLAHVKRVFNLYGPSEDTTYSTFAQMDPDGKAPPTIGRPIANTSATVVDPNFYPVPLGVRGELLLAGLGLARGYLRRPEATAEKWLPNPFTAKPGDRLYRTGDLARLLVTGAFVFLGRADHQVKIRGFRIEMGEIERQLTALPEVTEAAVLCQTSQTGSTRLAAFVEISGADKDPLPKTLTQLRATLTDRLPGHMVPDEFRILNLPRLANGKLDRQALAALPAVESEPSGEGLPRTRWERKLADLWQELLGRERVGIHDNFFDLGGHSLLLTQVHARLSADLTPGPAPGLVDLFRFPTIAALAGHLSGLAGQREVSHATRARIAKRWAAFNAADRAEIALIGLACRFPGAPDADAFWKNLRDGIESITFFKEEELAAAGVPAALLEDPNYVKAAAVLDDIDLFDADFFGIPPREAETMDPQHRLFLEGAWQALENAGYDPFTYPGPIGVFAGLAANSYLLHNLLSRPDLVASGDFFQAMIGNDKDFLPTRVSYKLDLKGPSINVQTSCSTSLTAVHLACQSLLLGECDLALAGGVSINVPQRIGYVYEEGMIQSPDGHCRAFDAKAGGTIGGGGLGLVVLKRLAEARADRDVIRAVIKGSAANNDGSDKVGYTAPGVEGQTMVIAEALAMAGVDPDSVTYVEAHGTGTPLGDPIEVDALNRAFQDASRDHRCALGSVKTNFGHLNTAAGIAGLIKTVLALEHGQLPPSLHFEEANPTIAFDKGPFYVNTSLTPWPAATRKGRAGPRRAGVSSFGIGGTNVHVVLEEAPEMAPAKPSRAPQLLVLSAKTDTALTAAKAQLAKEVSRRPDRSLADVAYTLQVGRAAFSHRFFAVCSHHDELQAVLDPQIPGVTSIHHGVPPVVFMFSGQGDLATEQAWALYQDESAFRRPFDQCVDLLGRVGGQSLESWLDPRGLRRNAGLAAEVVQPLLFVVEYALARMWQTWGVRPQAMIGHSLGEYVAACLAGVFTLEEALVLVRERGRLMATLPAGAMLAVALPEEEVRALLLDRLDLAAVNGPNRCVVSGPSAAIANLERILRDRGVACRRLQTSHAFHSHMMTPVLEPFRALLAKTDPQPPRIPFISNLSGAWITSQQAVDGEYWIRHLRQTVRFEDGLRLLFKDADRCFLEIGPGGVLAGLVNAHPAKGKVQKALHSLPRPGDRNGTTRHVLHTLGVLWSRGVPVNWQGFHGEEQPRRVTLPGYPFERRRFWVDPHGSTQALASGASEAVLKTDVRDWGYLPTWKEAPFKPTSQASGPFLMFMDKSGLGEDLAALLEGEGAEVARVTAGEAWGHEDGNYRLNPKQPEDYERLLSHIAARSLQPRTILHLWSIGEEAKASPAEYEVARDLDLTFFSLLHLAQAVGAQNWSHELEIFVLSERLYQIAGEANRTPWRATLLGPCRTIPWEYENLWCRNLDLALPQAGGWQWRRLLGQIRGELGVRRGASVTALRGHHRLVQALEPMALETAGSGGPGLKQGGVYLITGGLGGIGSCLARYLAENTGARLALLSRTPPPPRASWRNLTPAEEKQPSLVLLRDLERLGADFMVLAADVGDHSAMAPAVQSIRSRFGRINGVIHAAGLAGGGAIQLKTRAAALQVIAPKLMGTLVLDRVLAEDPPDFTVFCSSLTALAGGFGQVDYCAANAFLDAFAGFKMSRTGSFTLAVNWDAWREVGMAADGLGEGEGISPRHGAECFARLAHQTQPQVLVTPRDPQALARQNTPSNRTEDLPTEPIRGRGPHPRPNLPTPYQAPSREIEQKLCAIWSDCLGIEGIGTRDSFFDLGGDSLLATRVLSRIRKIFEVTLTLALLFSEPTILGLAELIENLRAGPPDQPPDSPPSEQREVGKL